MPYIEQVERAIVDPYIDDLVARIYGPKLDGQVNYVITRLLQGVYAHPLNYFNINRAMGVLECVKQEFYRKLAAPYEDRKEILNGPIPVRGCNGFDSGESGSQPLDGGSTPPTSTGGGND